MGYIEFSQILAFVPLPETKKDPKQADICFGSSVLGVTRLGPGICQISIRQPAAHGPGMKIIECIVDKYQGAAEMKHNPGAYILFTGYTT